MSRGGVSKASRTLHVSEDIFAGFNCVLRGGEVEYLEYIHCGKGRDMGFTAINGFEQKISSGNALQCASRDLFRLAERFDLFRLFSMYFSGSGFYITTMMTMWSVYMFAAGQLIFALTGAERYLETAWVEPVHEISHGRRLQTAVNASAYPEEAFNYAPFRISAASLGALDDYTGETDGLEKKQWVSGTYSAAYVVQLGFVMLLPYGMELIVERSLFYAIAEVLKLTLTGSFLFSLFAMQTKAANFANAVTYGRAAYIATGRGFQMDTISVVKLYSDYVGTHSKLYFRRELEPCSSHSRPRERGRSCIPGAGTALFCNRIRLSGLAASPWRHPD
eukprot:7033992-Prymnesium_polylepis.1